MNDTRFLSPREIESRIADGQLIVIHEGHALRLDRWIDKHPGGRLAILHMVGRDATDEINVYHFEHTLRLMKGYRIGRVRQPWNNFEPPLRGGVYRSFDGRKSEVEIQVVAPESDEDSTDKESVWSTESVSASLTLTRVSTANTSMTDLVVETTNEPFKPASGSAAFLGAGYASSGCTRRAVLPSQVDKDTKKVTSAPKPCPIKAKNLSRLSYTAALEQKEVIDGVRSYPSLDMETQLAITAEYQALHQRIKDEGLYQCRYSQYGEEMIRYSLLFGCFLLLLNAKWFLTSAMFLGMFWQQIMFTAHDAGHRGITGNFIIDTVIGAFIADFCCGLSIGWWKSSHNVHHLITNMPEHDPDIQNVPLFATSPEFFKSVRSTFYNFTFVWDKAADVLVPYQKYTYYPVMGIARFNLYLLSWLHLCSPRAANLGSAWWTRPVEIAFMACYWYIFGYRLLLCTLPTWTIRVAFVLISHIITMILHVQITLSHWGMPTSDLGPTESFPQRQLRTTMDVDCPAWLDFLHGGLQFQAVHHLFPRVPRHNLRAGQVLVREFCDKVGIEYQCHGFVKGNGIVLSRLEEVAKMVETLVACQRDMAETGDSGLLH